MKRAFGRAVGFLPILLLSCSGPRPVVEIDAHHWPDGSALSFVRDGKIVVRSTLFGDRMRVTLPKTGVYRIRVSSTETLAAFTPDIVVGSGTTACKLPLPVMRRRIGTTNLGLGFAAPGGEELCARLLETSPSSFTSIRFDPGGVADPGGLVRAAHGKAVEVVLSAAGPSQEFSRKSASALVDAAERLCADGVMLQTGRKAADPAGLAVVREAAALAHGRGLTFSLGLPSAEIGAFDPLAFFRNVPATECPDDLVAVCRGTAGGDEGIAVVSAVEVESAVIGMKDARIPLSRVTVEVALSALADGAGPDGKGWAAPGAGVLEGVLSGTGKERALRLPDGSLRIGGRGVNYMFDDLEGIARKISVLRTGEFARIRGVRIVWDGCGASPDSLGLAALAEVFGRPGEAVAKKTGR